MTIRLNHPTTLALTIALTLGLSACNDAQSKADATTANKNAPDKAQAIAFIQDAEAQMAQPESLGVDEAMPAHTADDATMKRWTVLSTAAAALAAAG